MNQTLSEVVSFLEANGQIVELHLSGYKADKDDFIVVRKRQLKIIMHDLLNKHNEITANLPADFRIIRLWEDVWKYSTDIVKSRLLSAIGKSIRLPARVMKVRRIDKPTANNFLNKHHLQGSPKAKFKYGLFLPKSYYRLVDNKSLIDEQSDEILVAVSTFSAPKTYYRENGKSRSIELIHFTNHSAFTIIGGLNKLLRFLEREQQPDDIMTYVDADWSNGEAFEKLGFERIEKTEPVTLFVNKKTCERHRRLPESEPPDNYVKICNSGNWKMIKETIRAKI